jgi:dGTPase
VLDAATKYPWQRGQGPGGTAKYGVYADDLPVFTWLRDGVPPGLRSLESQVMDWADDVAYSVHDLEDGIAAGMVDLARLDDPDERDALVALTASVYSDAGEAELAEVLDGLLALTCWPASYDGTSRDAAALKATTSTLIGRFCRAALTATREVAGEGPLSRYDADLVVPPRTRAECGLLKGVTARYVMSRAGAAAAQTRERETLGELVAALVAQPETLDPASLEAWKRAVDDAGRLRAVIDAVASLTDAGAVRRHGRLAR